jgi:hypothetical protein
LRAQLGKSNKHKEEGKMARMRFYVCCRKNGHETVVPFDGRWINEHGGVEKLEEMIRDDSEWYNPLGEQELPDGENQELMGLTTGALLEAWLEKGAPTIQGALNGGDTGSVRLKCARRYFFYKVCNEYGQEELVFQSEANIERHGGIQAIESEIAERASWFFPLGTLWFPVWGAEPSKGTVPYRRVKVLLDAWLELGSPRKPGKLAQKWKAASNGHSRHKESGT